MNDKKKVSTKVEDEAPQYRVKNGEVSWSYKRGEINLDVTELDQIFYEYSKHGLNLSQVQVQNKHGFNALEWQSLKRTFDLVKDSDVFSPYSLSQVSDKKACDMIADKIAEKYNPKNMRSVVEYEDRKQTKKAYEKAIKRASDLDYRFQILETEILDYVATAKPKTVRTCNDAKIESAIVHIADLHGGAKVKASRNLPAYNWKVLEKSLDSVSKDANSRKAKEVTVVMNGDMIETFTGLNHANSWKNIDEHNGYGISATIKVTDIISEFLGKMNNVKEVIFISGNHDRVTSSNKEDVEGEVARLISYIIKAQFPFKVVWEDVVATRKIAGCGFIFTHGHLFKGKKTEIIIEQYGFKGCFNIIIKGHLHSRKIVKDVYNGREIYSPSIFTGNNYSKGLGYSSRAGYLFVTVKDKLPLVVDCPL